MISHFLTFEPGKFQKEVNKFCNFVKTLKSSNLRLKFLKAFAMKRPYILLSAALLLFSLVSCSAYRNSATTPDDVYYSPGNPVAVTGNGDNSDYYNTPNENYVKMRVQDPDRWSYFDNYNYDYYGGMYSPYGYGSGIGLSLGYGTGFYDPMMYGGAMMYGGFGYYSPMSYYNSYYAWNSFYNPYYGSVVVVNGKNYNSPSYTRLSNFNPSAYQNNYYNTRPNSHFYNSNATRNYYNNNNFNRYNNNRPNNYSNPSPMRSSPSNFSSGGGLGGGGGAMRGGGFSRPGR